MNELLCGKQAADLHLTNSTGLSISRTLTENIHTFTIKEGAVLKANVIKKVATGLLFYYKANTSPH